MGEALDLSKSDGVQLIFNKALKLTLGILQITVSLDFFSLSRFSAGECIIKVLRISVIDLKRLASHIGVADTAHFLSSSSHYNFSVPI